MPNGCRVWTGAHDQKGYGQIRRGGRAYRVHRVIWSAKHGPIPPGILICHECDNPPCTEERHLFAGSAKAQREREIDEEIEKRLFLAIHANAPKQLPTETLAVIAEQLFDTVAFENEELLFDAWKWKEPPSTKELLKLSAPQLNQLLFEQMLLHLNAAPNLLKDTARRMGIDEKKIRAEVATSLKSPAPARPAKKKAARK